MDTKAFLGSIAGFEEILVDNFTDVRGFHRALFVSHCHSDHREGLGSKNILNLLTSSQISLYTTKETASLLSKTEDLKHLKSYFTILELGGPFSVAVGDGKHISVTVLPAAHCSGSVMFLFSRNGIRSLYTGDFRLTLKEPLHPIITEHPINNLYVDTTFFSKKKIFREFPLHQHSIDMIRTFIYDRPTASIHIDFSAGREPIAKGLAATFPIRASRAVLHEFSEIPEVMRLFSVASDCRVHVGPGRDGGCELCRPETLQITPSIMWRAFFPTTNMNLHEKEPGKFSIAYSMHCSYLECERFIQLVGAEKVFPIVVPPEMTLPQIKAIMRRYSVVPKRKLSISDSDDDTASKKLAAKTVAEDLGSEYSDVSTESDDIVIPLHPVTVYLNSLKRNSCVQDSGSTNNSVTEGLIEDSRLDSDEVSRDSEDDDTGSAASEIIELNLSD